MSTRTSLLIVLLAAVCLPVAQARDPMPPGPPGPSGPASAGPSPMRADTPQRGAMDGSQRSTMDGPRTRMVSEVDVQQQELLQRQKRRDDLREMLRVQSDEHTAPQRQLSAQEKMELRQQLRQQQEWPSK